MNLSFKHFILVISGLGFLLSAVVSPDLVSRLLSDDGILYMHTVWELQIWRITLSLISASLLLLISIWGLGQNTFWIQRIEADYAQWQSPVLNLDAENRSWARTSIYLVFFVVVVGLVTIWLSFEHYEADWFALLAFESGFVETLQALFLLIAGVVLVGQAWRDRRSGGGPFCLVGLLYGLLLIIGAGEEISWGQHWLGFQTPEALESVNVQKEFNLHNIGSYWANNLQALLFLVYMGFWPALGYVYPQLHYLLDRLSMPIAPLMILPIVLLGSTMDDHGIFHRLWNEPPWRLSEARELLFSGAMLMIVLLMRRYRNPTLKPLSN